MGAAIGLSLIVTGSSAETRVGGILHGENRWDPSNGPYIVESDIVVSKFSHLSIMPGTQIIVDTGKGKDTAEGIPQFDALDSTNISIKVEGALTCVGRKNLRISFASVAGDGGKLGWYGIVFSRVKSASNEIAFTDVSGACNGVTINDCKPLIRTSVLTRNNIGVNCLKTGNALVYNCVIAENITAGIRIQEANPRIANSIIVFNRNNGLWCDGSSQVTFEYNCVFGNSDGNFLDCDPRLGRLVRVNKRKDSVDYADNLFCDPMFAGSSADSIAFARDLKIPTDKSKVNDTSLARTVEGAIKDSSFEKYRARKTLPYELSRYSPCRNAGDPGSRLKNTDGSRNDIGIFGGPEFFTREK